MTRKIAALLLALLLAACSSTKDQSSKVSSGDEVASDSSSESDGKASTGDDPGGAGSRDAAGGGPGADDGGGGGGGSGPGARAPGERTVGPAAGRGFTAKTIKVGVHILDEESVNAAALAFGIQTGGEELKTTDWINVVVRHINVSGGILGRKLETVIVKLDAAQQAGNQADAQETAACNRMTEDEKVFAAVAIGPTRAAFTECMAKKKTAVIVDNFNMYTLGRFRQAEPYLYFPAGPSSDRAMKTVVEGLHNQGYFGAKPKIGVVHPGTNDFPR